MLTAEKAPTLRFTNTRNQTISPSTATRVIQKYLMKIGPKGRAALVAKINKTLEE